MARVKEFSFTRDRDLIMWKDTLVYNGMRAASAGLTMGVIALLAGEPAGDIVPGMFVFPLGYYFFMLPLGVVAHMLSFIPFIGWITAMFALFVAIGDPLLFVFNKFRPDLVPMERPPFFSLKLIGFVLLPFDE